MLSVDSRRRPETARHRPLGDHQAMSASETPPSNTAGPGTVNQKRPPERRKRAIPVALDRRGVVGARAQLPERRRQVDPTTCERYYNDEEIMFMKSMDQYKRDNRRPF